MKRCGNKATRESTKKEEGTEYRRLMACGFICKHIHLLLNKVASDVGWRKKSGKNTKNEKHMMIVFA